MFEETLLRMFCELCQQCRRTRRVAAVLEIENLTIQGDMMQLENLVVGQQVQLTSLTPIDVNSKPTNGSVKSDTFTSSDPTIFTVGPDPTNPLGAILTAVAAGSALLTISATGVEADGTTAFTNVPGSVSIVVAGKPNPTVAVLANFGTPFTPPATPPAPGTAH